MFPVLTQPQIDRFAAHGRLRQVARGEVLLERGALAAHVFVVIRGEIEVVRPTGTSSELVAVFHQGMFTGEVAMRSGRRSLVKRVASAVGEGSIAVAFVHQVLQE